MGLKTSYKVIYDFQLVNYDLSKPDVIVAVTHLFLLGKNFVCVDSDGTIKGSILPRDWNVRSPVYDLKYELDKKPFTLTASIENNIVELKFKADGNFPVRTAKVDLEKVHQPMDGDLSVAVPDYKELQTNLECHLLERIELPTGLLSGLSELRLKDRCCLCVGLCIILGFVIFILWGYSVVYYIRIHDFFSYNSNFEY